MVAQSLRNFREIGRKIICVGRNYRDHVAEFNNPVPSKPMLFSKTTNCYLAEEEGKIRRPPGCSVLHYEVELGVIIGQRATNISKADAMSYIGGYTIALDMTARDLQDELKSKGHPWFIAKSFDTACPVGEFIEVNQIPNSYNVEIYCKKNDEFRQKSSTNAMIFNVTILIEYASRFVTLERGDLLLTGTPAGVGACHSGDRLEIGIIGITKSIFEVE